MANVDNPHGFLPVGYMVGGGPPATLELSKAATYAVAFYPGDLVHRVADGTLESNSATPGTTRYSGVNLSPGAASTLTKHLVITDPKMVFEGQGDDDTDLDAADLGLNANALLSAGSATTGKSGHEIDASTKNTTNTLDLKLLQLHTVAGNAHGKWARIQVLINKHRMNPEVAGV